MRWSRPYETFGVFVGYVVLIVLSLSVSLIVVLSVQTWDHLDRALPTTAAVMVGVGILMWRRFIRAGLYVGDEGVRVRWMWRGRTISWAEVSGFVVGPYSVRGAWDDGRGLWITRRDGSTVKTPILRVPVNRSSGLGEVFEATTNLPQDVFDQLVVDLRRLHAWSVEGGTMDATARPRRSARRIRPKPNARSWRRRR